MKTERIDTAIALTKELTAALGRLKQYSYRAGTSDSIEEAGVQKDYEMHQARVDELYALLREAL